MHINITITIRMVIFTNLPLLIRSDLHYLLIIRHTTITATPHLLDADTKYLE
jgi:hypothetical protein